MPRRAKNPAFSASIGRTAYFFTSLKTVFPPREQASAKSKGLRSFADGALKTSSTTSPQPGLTFSDLSPFCPPKSHESVIGEASKVLSLRTITVRFTSEPGAKTASHSRTSAHVGCHALNMSSVALPSPIQKCQPPSSCQRKPSDIILPRSEVAGRHSSRPRKHPSPPTSA